MKCTCGCDNFKAVQAIRGTVSIIVTISDSGAAFFQSNDTKDGQLDSSELDCDNPEGPFICCGCGKEFDEEAVQRSRS